MLRKEGTIVVPMTDAIIKEFHEMDECPVERSFSMPRVKRLLEIFAESILLPFIWAMVEVGGRFYRVNGQHTSYIFANKLCPVPEDAEVVLVQFTGDDLEDVAQAWARFDSGDRTPSEIISAYASTDLQLKEIPKGIHNSITSGIKMAKDKGAYKKVFSDKLGKSVLDNKEFSLFCYGIYKGSLSAKECRVLLIRAPVIAAMFLTYLRDPEDSYVFWRNVRDGEGQKGKDPERTLHDYLMKTSLSKSSQFGTRVDRKEEMFVKCIRAWNAWRSGAHLSVLKGGKRTGAR